MESLLFWVLNSIETGLILSLLLHTRKADERILESERRTNTKIENLAKQIPNYFMLNGETIHLRKKD